MYYSALLVYTRYIYFFSSDGVGGGGTALSSSGRFGVVPSPICSQGESESKFLNGCSHKSSQPVLGRSREGAGAMRTHVPESLSELERLIDDPLALLVVAYLSIALYRHMKG